MCSRIIAYCLSSGGIHIFLWATSVGIWHTDQFNNVFRSIDKVKKRVNECGNGDF
jgi:hypothetical protein